jgi:hypothetical protein
MTAEEAKPHVEILAFQGCPNVGPTRALVERIARELALDPVLEMIDVPDAEAATRLRFLGSPSVRVNGVDEEPGADGCHEYVFSCRVYRAQDGYAGRPSEEWLRTAFERAAGAA